MKMWRDERQEVIREALGRNQAAAWESFDTRNRDNWDAMCDWLHEQLGRYLIIFEADPAERSAASQ